MFKRMKSVVKSSIETARAKLAADKADHQSAEQISVTEIAVVERHSSMAERLASASTDFEKMSVMLKDRYTSDAVPEFAAQLAVDSTRVDWAAGELAKIEAVRANLPRILAEFEKCTVHACQAELRAFEAEHRAVLRKYNAIN